MSNFYLVCGISGGGKTTLSNKIKKLNPYLKVFDVDEYYAKINGDECIRDNFFDVWINLYEDIHKSELDNQDVIITTNALTVSQRMQFIEWFPTFKHHLIWVTAPKHKCIEGNNSRKRTVPLDKLLAQWDRMEFPNANEKGWDTIAQITNCWDNENYIIFNLKGNIEYLLTIKSDDTPAKWIFDNKDAKFHCSKCKNIALYNVSIDNCFGVTYKVVFSEYCPHCGCKMKS